MADPVVFMCCDDDDPDALELFPDNILFLKDDSVFISFEVIMCNVQFSF